jgi:phosphoglycerate dehydrogenase-like enzyme
LAASDSQVTVLLSRHFPQEVEPLIEAVSPRLRVLHQSPETGAIPPGGEDAEVLAWWSDREGFAELRAALPRLGWVQASAAGIGDQHLDELLGPEVTLTSAAGIYGDLVAEHVLSLILALNRRLPELLENQRLGLWRDVANRTISGQTLGIIGAGGIGRASARMARAFGMRSIGVRRGPGAIPDLDQTLPMDRLPDLLAVSDAVLLSAPLTNATRGMVDASFLRSMRQDAVLINVGRGALVVTDDLVRALSEGWIGGAGLDVTDPEPLPEGHPLWRAPNLIITPHHANPEQASREPMARHFCENLRRYLAKEPLLSKVDPARGY